jgi:hypothetical protein
MTTNITIRPCACGNPTCTQGSVSLRVGHGHYSFYTNHNCRCDLCKDAYRVYRQKYRRPAVQICGCGNPLCGRRTRRQVAHGLSCYFRHKCRCETCRAGMREYQRNRREWLRAVKASEMPKISGVTPFGNNDLTRELDPTTMVVSSERTDV